MKNNSLLYGCLALTVTFFIVFFIFYGDSTNSTSYIKLELPNQKISQDNEKNDFTNTKNNVSTSLEPPKNQFKDDSIESKIERENELNRLAAKEIAIYSDEKLFDILTKRGAKIDAEMAARMKSESMTAKDREVVNILIAELFSEEENFKIELKQYNGFNELKEAADRRSEKTGLFYGEDLLSEPMIYKNATFHDIKNLLDSGADLPENAIEFMIYAGNIDVAVELKNAGYNLNTNYVDKLRSMNAIETQASKYAANPYATSAEEQINTFKKLLDLGVDLKVNDGTRDALDIVLGAVNHQYSDQAEKLLIVAKNFHELGIPLEKSHFQLLEEIKSKHPDLHKKYAPYFQ